MGSGAALNHSAPVNASGFLAEDDLEELGLTELQTVGVACVATLVPLGLALFAVFGLRMVWKQWREDVEERTLRRADSSDPNKSSHMLLPDEIKTSESQFSVIPAEELEEVMTSYTSAASGNTSNHNHTSQHNTTANGSIITMTMKNNHLIVETEERVLVSNECMAVNKEESTVEVTEAEARPAEALVHRVQEGSNTGLSQSDLSLSSSGSNPAYSYGNQQEYQSDERHPLPQTLPPATKMKHLPFLVQPSQDIEDDELYLEQQHQLGNGLEEQQFQNPAFSESLSTMQTTTTT